MIKIATYASRRNVLEKPILGNQIITMGTNNPLVPGNGPVLAEFGTVNTALQNINDEINVLREQLRAKISARRSVLTQWSLKLNSVVGYTLSACNGSPEAVESAGMYVVPPPERPQHLEAPVNLVVRTNGTPGVSKLTWKVVDDATSYLAQSSTDPDDPDSWGGTTPCTKANVEIEGAAPGKLCWFRVCAVNPLGQGPWSAPAPRPVM